MFSSTSHENNLNGLKKLHPDLHKHMNRLSEITCGIITYAGQITQMIVSLSCTKLGARNICPFLKP